LQKTAKQKVRPTGRTGGVPESLFLGGGYIDTNVKGGPEEERQLMRKISGQNQGS